MRIKSLSVALSVALALALTACGGASPATTDVKGKTLTGDGYSLKVPESWVDVDSGTALTEISVAEPEDGVTYRNNLNVIPQPGAGSLEEVESVMPDELPKSGAEDVKVEARVKLDGAEASHLSALIDRQGVQYNADQMYAFHSSNVYVITLNTRVDLDSADRAELLDMVIDSWKWQ